MKQSASLCAPGLFLCPEAGGWIMQQGYIKLYRSALSHGWLRNHKLWILWCYLLLKASYCGRTVLHGSSKITLDPGQLIFGRRAASLETGLSEQAIRSTIKILVDAKNITIQTTNRFSIITLVNWGLYQSDGQASTSKTTKHQPTTNQPTGHKQEVFKNIKIKEEGLDLSGRPLRRL
jgi:hypothetical protein